MFIPSGEMPYTPSNHLRSVTDMKSFREIIRTILAKAEGVTNIDENTARILASYRKLDGDMQNAENLGKKPMIGLGDLQDEQNSNKRLYCVAFGNPLERENAGEVRQ